MQSIEADVKPFQRWITTLRTRNHTRSHSSPAKSISQPRFRTEVTSADGTSLDFYRPIKPNSVSEVSSDNLIRGVNSATITVGSVSVMNKSQSRNPLSLLHSNNRGFKRRSEDHRNSSDSYTHSANVTDPLAWLRAVQRRRILEELITSEEAYINDLKVLVNVYATLLASASTVSVQTRASICENITQILQIHESLLNQLHQVVPDSEVRHSEFDHSLFGRTTRHIRWHSADGTNGKHEKTPISRKLRRSLDIPRPIDDYPAELVVDPQTSAAVAQVFEHNMRHFFVYEEYGAKYEKMVKDLAVTHKAFSTKDAFEKGIEILSRTLASINNRECQDRKGMLFGDLLIKPIQRVCKYPLLFADLCKNTPVTDDPEAHALISKVLMRLKETAREINRATDDPKARQMIEKTWLLQDRLVFEDATLQAVAARLLGNVVLCGVLYVAYQSLDGIKGNYLLSALFKSVLLLALADKNLSSFTVVASIPLMDLNIEDSDNGRGLQCHTAPHSFKLVFEMNYQLFELMLSACSIKEEQEWRRYLEEGIGKGRKSFEQTYESCYNTDFLSSLNLDLKPIGNVFGNSQTLTRKLSIRRALTLNPKPGSMSQVVIKNTQARNSSGRGTPQQIDSDISLPMVRSQSLLASAANIPILAPRRSERSQLESALADVWSKDVLPFPGMGPRIVDIRISANNVMRKLSMANLSANFNKRLSADEDKLAQLRRRASKADFTTAAKIDFHHSPEKFLPPDFGIEGVIERRKKKGWFWK